MTIDDLRRWKKYLGYSNKQLADRAGLPLGTVQKVLSGESSAPRYKTIVALEKAIEEGLAARSNISGQYNMNTGYGISGVHEPGALSVRQSEYNASAKMTDIMEDAWTGKWRRQGSYNTEDYYAIPEGIRVELIDGVFYNLSAPSFTHQEIVAGVFYQICSFRENHSDILKECRVVMSPYDVQLSDAGKTIVQPDLIIFCGRKRDEYEKMLKGAPEFIMEVVSPSSQSLDYVIKTNLYMDAGVKEYWIVDPIKDQIVVFDFAGENLNRVYTFDDNISVRITGGNLSVDFSKVRDR